VAYFLGHPVYGSDVSAWPWLCDFGHHHHHQISLLTAVRRSRAHVAAIHNTVNL